MPPRRKPSYKILRAITPILLLLGIAFCGLLLWLVYKVTRPPRHEYLVTPERFEGLSSRGTKAQDDQWSNNDGSTARGWLLRGTAGSPAVILLHRWGTDRSWLFNLGVALNEATNFTVLCPDQRGHGQNALVSSSSFGSLESGDVLAALEHLKSLQMFQGHPLVGHTFGLYGVEMGAYAALKAASTDRDGSFEIKSLILDSVPGTPEDVLRTALKTQTGVESPILQVLSNLGVRIYFLGKFQNVDSCQLAHELHGKDVLLLSGSDSETLRSSTLALSRCFPPDTKLEVKSDLPVTGLRFTYANGEEGEAYNRQVISFFDQSLR